MSPGRVPGAYPVRRKERHRTVRCQSRLPGGRSRRRELLMARLGRDGRRIDQARKISVMTPEQEQGEG